MYKKTGGVHYTIIFRKTAFLKASFLALKALFAFKSAFEPAAVLETVEEYF